MIDSRHYTEYAHGNDTIAIHRWLALIFHGQTQSPLLPCWLHPPLSFHGSQRNAEERGNFLCSHPTEEPHLHDLGAPRVALRELLQCFVQGAKVYLRFGRQRRNLVERDPAPIFPALAGIVPASMVDA